MQIKVTKLPKSEIEIEGELDAGIFETYFSKALKNIGEKMELPGFRKGKAPENIVLAQAGEIRVLEEMAELALAEHYPKIIKQEKLDVVGRPSIGITKLARNNPLGFKIKSAVLPEVALPNYKKIAKDILEGATDKDKDTTVSDKELEDTIMDIRKSRAPKVHMAAKSSEAGSPDASAEASREVPTELPELNDDFVQALGPFKDVEDFKQKLKENIKLEKGNQVKEKMRLKIIEKIIDDTTIDTPDILIESELQKILYRMESDITQMGLKFDDYLKHLNKTVEDLKKEFRNDAEKKAKFSLVLNEIAKTEKIIPDDEQVAKEVAHILEHYKDADPERARMHAENVLTNEKIFQFLESQ